MLFNANSNTNPLSFGAITVAALNSHIQSFIFQTLEHLAGRPTLETTGARLSAS